MHYIPALLLPKAFGPRVLIGREGEKTRLWVPGVSFYMALAVLLE